MNDSHSLKCTKSRKHFTNVRMKNCSFPFFYSSLVHLTIATVHRQNGHTHIWNMSTASASEMDE